MATIKSQDKEFLDAVINRTLLEDSIDWIKVNMNPLDVFSEKDLISWAHDCGLEEVFTEKELNRWAEDNGYEKQ